jgi:hypothetical protein
MPTEISGSTGVNKIQDNTIVNADINSSAAIAGSKISGSFGKVLQVVYGTTNTATQTGSASYQDTGLSASITPSATSSKVLILVGQTLEFSTDTGSARECYWNIVRGSTQILLGSATQNAPSGDHLRVGIGHFLNHLDSPNTTSATTYKTQMKVSAGSSDIYAQSNSTTSTIILMEIAG